MSDEEPANLIPEIQKLANEIVEMSKKSSTKPAKFDELVKKYYKILEGVTSELKVVVDINNNPEDVASIKKITDQIVVKLKSDGNFKISKDNLTNLLGFFKAYHAIIGNDIDDVVNEMPEKANDAAPNENLIKLMVDTNDINNRIAMGFISEKEPIDTKIFGKSFVYNDNFSDYKPHWFIEIPDSKNDEMISFLQKAVTENKDAKSVTINGIEYEIVDMEYLKKENTGGMRRRTRKNKRRITKRKVNKNKRKTKKH